MHNKEKLLIPAGDDVTFMENQVTLDEGKLEEVARLSAK